MGPVKGIKIGPETTYGTASVSMSAVHARGSTLKPNRRLAESTDWMSAEPGRSEPMAAGVTGEITFGATLTDAIDSIFLKAVGDESSSPYAVGCSGWPTTKSLTIAENYGGDSGSTLEYNTLGAIPVKIRLDLPSNADAFWTLGYAARSMVLVGSPSDPSPPAGSTILMPSDYGAVSIGGTAITYKRAFVEATIGHDFIGLDDVGATVPRAAVWKGSWRLTSGFEFDLDDTSGSDSASILTDFVDASTQGELGSVTIGSLVTLTNFKMTSDKPALGPGNVPFSISGSVDAMNFVTT